MSGHKILGIAGCGAIGGAIYEAMLPRILKGSVRVVLYDTDIQNAEKLARKHASSRIARSMEELFDLCDIVVESASAQAAVIALEFAIRESVDIMILSVGGLMDKEDLLVEAFGSGIKVILPSGAIGAIDALRAAAIAGIRSVTLTTRKSPDSLSGAPYLSERGIDIKGIAEETIIFEGSAREAVKAFPKNINVSALLSIFGIGSELTKVKIISSPEYSRNVHEVSVESEAGKFMFRSENVPFPSNPKTSYLAALSAINCINEYFGAFTVYLDMNKTT